MPRAICSEWLPGDGAEFRSSLFVPTVPALLNWKSPPRNPSSGWGSDFKGGSNLLVLTVIRSRLVQAALTCNLDPAEIPSSLAAVSISARASSSHSHQKQLDLVSVSSGTVADPMQALFLLLGACSQPLMSGGSWDFLSPISW